MNKKKFSILIFITVLAIAIFEPKGLYAQDLKFEDIYDDLDNLTDEQAYTRFLQFQSQNPHFANTYLQLGQLSEKFYTETDPLRNIDLVKYWTDRAALYYGLFPVYFESTELRRNRRFYTSLPIESDVRLRTDDMLEFAEAKRKYARNYKDTLILIYEALEKSKDHYNNCVRVFNKINNDYDNLNEALLRTNDDLIKALETLQDEFDLCISEFAKYKELLEKFPLKGFLHAYQVQLGNYMSTVETMVGAYNQKYNLRPIYTFRLDGLTNSDFLKDTFNLWDYDLWVKSFQETFRNDIIPLRKEVEEIQKTFDENQRFLSRVEFAEPEMNLMSYDELFLFRLGKYDNNSIVRELFDYLRLKQDYLLISKNQLNNSTDSIAEIMGRKLRYYYRFSIHQTNSLKGLERFCSSITTYNTGRFEGFFEKYYKGEAGLHNFCIEENSFLTKNFQTGLNKLNYYFQNIDSLRYLNEYATGSRGVKIPLIMIDTEHDDYESLNYISRDVFYEYNNPLYTGGYIKRQDKHIPFIAKLNEENKIEWIKEIEPESIKRYDSEKYTEVLFGYEAGVQALIAAKIGPTDDSQEIDLSSWYSNFLIHYDSKGRMLFSKEIDDNNFPVFLYYDEINQVSRMAFGKKENGFDNAYAQISFSEADSTGTLKWNNSVRLKGNLADFIKVEDRYIAYLNFQEYDIDGDFVKASNDGKNWALLVLELSEEGHVIRAKPFIYDESYYIDRVYSISSDEINLIGYKGEPGNNKGSIVYKVISSKGEVIFRNIE